MVKPTILVTLWPERSKIPNHLVMHDESLQLTEPDLTASLYQMVQTGIVSGGTKNYTYGPDMDDEELHENEDFSKVTKKDPVLMQMIIDSNNYNEPKPIENGNTTESTDTDGNGDNTGNQ